MSGNTTLGFAGDDVVTLLESREQNGGEVERPEPVTGFLQADVLINHRIREVQQPAAKAKCPVRLAHISLVMSHPITTMSL